MKQLPAEVVPYLDRVRSRVIGRNAPVDFWQIDSGPAILDGFAALAAELALSSLDEAALPRGYSLIALLFGWETHCQFDGWGAFGNIDKLQFARICAAFTEVGLEAEAQSLELQMQAYHDAAGVAEVLAELSVEVTHALSGDLDRLEYLTQYFCDHADELLYMPQNSGPTTHPVA